MEAATFGAEWIVRRIGVSGDGGGLLVGESAASECHADVGRHDFAIGRIRL